MAIITKIPVFSFRPAGKSIRFQSRIKGISCIHSFHGTV
jgi:hypothetical protein